jgi:hypothetical protein
VRGFAVGDGEIQCFGFATFGGELIFEQRNGFIVLGVAGLCKQLSLFQKIFTTKQNIKYLEALCQL